MITVREKIIQALCANLAAAIQGAPIMRSRVAALSRKQLPVIVVEAISDSPDASSSIGVITWSLTIRVAVLVLSNAPDTSADQFVAAVHSCLVQDKSLGGLCMDIEPADVKFEVNQAEQPIAVISLGYTVNYRTTDADLSLNR